MSRGSGPGARAERPAVPRPGRAGPRPARTAALPLAARNARGRRGQMASGRAASHAPSNMPGDATIIGTRHGDATGADPALTCPIATRERGRGAGLMLPGTRAPAARRKPGRRWMRPAGRSAALVPGRSLPARPSGRPRTGLCRQEIVLQTGFRAWPARSRMRARMRIVRALSSRPRVSCGCFGRVFRVGVSGRRYGRIRACVTGGPGVPGARAGGRAGGDDAKALRGDNVNVPNAAGATRPPARRASG